MKIKNNIMYFVLLLSSLVARTPIEYSISLSSGYDDNVLRFSDEEFNEAKFDKTMLGGASTFDSFITRIGVTAKKLLWVSGSKSFIINGLYRYTDYYNNPEKKYWSGGLDATYKWGSYKNIKYSIRHLNSFYLRHYIDRDISNDLLAACLFTDRNQSLILTQKSSKKSWFNVGIGYLQRYYDQPFSEFDLDIIYMKGKFNYKIKRVGNLAFQINRGSANSKSHLSIKRPSSFDRSYESIEWYMPFKIQKGILFLDEIGLSVREEYRQYKAEDPDDPLHAGRDHIDSKYDLWIKKNLFESLAITISGRYRNRSTSSAYEWVTDLKSFKQIQYWCKLEWDMIYDRY